MINRQGFPETFLIFKGDLLLFKTIVVSPGSTNCRAGQQHQGQRKLTRKARQGRTLSTANGVCVSALLALLYSG
jgi:hypothetical protein